MSNIYEATIPDLAHRIGQCEQIPRAMEINFFPIKFEFEEFQINYENYSDERLTELRKEFNTTHSFFRSEDKIYISNKCGDDDLFTGRIDKLNIQRDRKATSSLIKHLFFRTFKEKFPKRKPTDFYPFRFFSKKERDDLIYGALPDNLKNQIAYKKLIELQLREWNQDGHVHYGFVINVKRNWIFNKSCLELSQEGFNLVDLEVLRYESLPGLDNVLAPNEEFIGVISSIKGNKAFVETSEGESEIELSELTLRKTKLNIGKYLEYAISPAESIKILNIIENKRSEVLSASALLQELTLIAKGLFTEKNDTGKNQPILFQNKDGFCFTVESYPKRFNNSIDLSPPTFIFDYAATKTKQNYPDRGLSDFGPYDSINFDIKNPKVLCICHKDNRGVFTEFLAHLFEGLPQSKYFKKGFKKKYDLHSIDYSLEEINSFLIENYLQIIRSERDTKPDLAIIEIPENFRTMRDSENPYYKIKAKLLSLEVPVQFVTSEKIKNHNEYILNSIGLQLYAKLGGTPWVLPSNRSVDREIVIGIGHSWIRESQYKGAVSNRVVGITTFMSSDGQYLLGDKVKDVEYEDYFKELLSSLENSFERLKGEQGWQDGDTIRLIFHVFKPIKNVEYDVVNSIIGKFKNFKVQYAFVTIGKRHPFKLFDPTQVGVPVGYNTRTMKGICIPDRGSNLFLDSQTCIVQMLGARELKTDRHGMSNPIQIKIRTPEGGIQDSELQRLLFTDLNYIVQQVFSFTYLSWRSFLPGEEPATMLYSNLISRLLGKMRKVQGWDPDSLNYKLKRKKWFL